MARPRQVSVRETSASEPLMTCRKGIQMTSKPRVIFGTLGQVRGKAAYCPVGVRHEDGVNLTQAFVRNVGTCRLAAKGKPQAEDPQEGKY